MQISKQKKLMTVTAFFEISKVLKSCNIMMGSIYKTHVHTLIKKKHFFHKSIIKKNKGQVTKTIWKRQKVSADGVAEDQNIGQVDKLTAKLQK
jgi:hypothetical protein